MFVGFLGGLGLLGFRAWGLGARAFYTLRSDHGRELLQRPTFRASALGGLGFKGIRISSGLPKMRDAIHLGRVPLTRIIVFWVLYFWKRPCSGNVRRDTQSGPCSVWGVLRDITVKQKQR